MMHPQTGLLHTATASRHDTGDVVGANAAVGESPGRNPVEGAADQTNNLASLHLAAQAKSQEESRLAVTIVACQLIDEAVAVVAVLLRDDARLRSAPRNGEPRNTAAASTMVSNLFTIPVLAPASPTPPAVPSPSH